MMTMIGTLLLTMKTAAAASAGRETLPSLYPHGAVSSDRVRLLPEAEMVISNAR
jgi:hypothetical protein